MVEVFKTNIRTKREAERVVKKLKQHENITQANVDLQDCDKILRVEGTSIPYGFIRELVLEMNIKYEILSDN